MTHHFTHLHLHTEYSLLDGAIRIPDLLTFAKEQDWKAIGISDHGNIFGAIKFFQQAKKIGIKPVLGIEMYFTPDIAIKDSKERYNHLIVIVQNKQGYKNLCRLIAHAYQEGYYFKPRIDYALLEKYHDGLIVTTACVGGHIPSLLRDGNIEEAQKRSNWFLNIFGPDRFFFELQPAEFDKQKELNPLLLKYSQEWGIKCIATSDAHYLSKSDKEAHEVMLAVQTKDNMDNPDRFSFGECQAYVRNTAEMLEAFPNNHDLIWNTGFIADQCDFSFDFGKLFFPNFPIPTAFTQETYFASLCTSGLDRLYNNNLIAHDQHSIYKERLNLEINLITKMGFIGYFLVVSDFICWAKQQNIPVGPGRGSAAGSLVAWALQITNIDPIRYNLLFERFLNPERISMPDIDIDFCINRREDVINYVKNKYGSECVCQIITFGTMLAKGVIKDVGRALGLPFQDTNAITDLIPDQLKITLQEAFEQEPRLQQLRDNNHKINRLFDIAFRLEGLTRHASKHAAGVVISPERLADCLPLYVPTKGTDLVSQFAMTELEAVGFLKMDFLGLQNLTVIEHAINVIKKNHDININLDTLPLDDSNTFALLCKGRTKGVFQFESDGIAEVLRKLQPDKFEDLIAVNALYRPGPLGSGMVDDYIDCRHGKKDIIYMFPALENILKETYGVIVYQEQVIKIASTIAGYTLGGADILRKAMGKKKPEEMAKQKEIFLDGAKKNGFDEKKSAELFDLMAYFAGYGFNKSHSAAYALIAYQTAYLKANYPNEFMASLISFETDNPNGMYIYLQEIHDMGIQTIPPDINVSEIAFVANSNGIIFGLQGIKNVGLAALESILTERTKKPFLDLFDFCKRVDLRVANKRVLENLIYAGAMDSLQGNRAQKIAELDTIINQAQVEKEAARTGQMGLFSFGQKEAMSSENNNTYYVFQQKEDLSIKVRLEKEKEVTGFYLSAHPLKAHPIVDWIHHTSFSTALQNNKTPTTTQEQIVTTCCLIQSRKVITTKKGAAMAFLMCEDMSGTAEIIIFPSLYTKVSELLEQYSIFVIQGTVDSASQVICKIKAQNIIPIENILTTTGLIKTLVLKLPSTCNESLLEKIKTTLPSGNTTLIMQFIEQDTSMALYAAQTIHCTQEALGSIQNEGIEIKILLNEAPAHRSFRQGATYN